ncbi:MAG TPA: hypothetical protein VJY85_08800, partial [Candidatus Limnocylindria bacterium]|nr:hypothetical protein [Candidatus Limnocylindria bacterium]
MSATQRSLSSTAQRLLVALSMFALLLGAMAPVALAARSHNVGTKSFIKAQHVGTTRITGRAPRGEDEGVLTGEVRPDPEERAEEGEREKFIRNPISTARVPSSHVPRPAVQPIVDATGTTHFGGLNHFDQRFSGTGDYTNTQFSLEPPDQALCVGNGFVVESVNTVIRVRNPAGANLTAAMPLNDFFNLEPEIIRADPLVFGEFTSDPKCYFDTDTDRWFVTILELDVDPDSGAFTGPSSVMIAVSTSGDPTGTWNLFSIDTTNDGTGGTPTHDDCPCFGDQPLIGADANGFYVTTNEFPVFEAGFNGANVYAMSKTALAAGSLGTVVLFHQPTLAEGQAYSIQPATTPPGAAYATGHGGTEYFLSALEFTGGLDNRIALWALTNSSSLSSATPTVAMQLTILDSQVYGAPPTMQQRDGPTPLKALIKSKLAPAALGVPSTSEHLNLLNSNDDRMNQTVFVNGQIWGALNTVMKSPTGQTRTGIAWFGVTPAFGGSTLGGSVSAQGYVALRNTNAAFPAVAANPAGDVLVGYSVVSPAIYPSAAYSWIGAGGTGAANVVAWGVGPADGFTGYISLDPGDGGVERWGDYSA